MKLKNSERINGVNEVEVLEGLLQLIELQLFKSSFKEVRISKYMFQLVSILENMKSRNAEIDTAILTRYKICKYFYVTRKTERIEYNSLKHEELK